LKVQHLIYSLSQFIAPNGVEEKLVKQYLDIQKKKYQEHVKQSEASQIESGGSPFELKQIVTRITIEGESTMLLLLRQLEFDRNSEWVLELTPMLNAPH